MIGWIIASVSIVVVSIGRRDAHFSPRPYASLVLTHERPPRGLTDVAITLARTGADFGASRSPNYDVTIFGDGSVLWHGIQDVWEMGERRTRISRAAVAQLVAKLEGARFFALDDQGKIIDPRSTDREWTTCSDTATTTMSFRRNREEHVIIDRHCDDIPILTLIEASIEGSIALRDWVDGPPKRYDHVAQRLVGHERASLGDVYGSIKLGMPADALSAWIMLADTDDRIDDKIRVVLHTAHGRLVEIEAQLPTCANTLAALDRRWGQPEHIDYVVQWTNLLRGTRVSFNDVVCTLTFENVIDVATLVDNVAKARALIGHPARDVRRIAGPDTNDDDMIVSWSLPGVGVGRGTTDFTAEIVDDKVASVTINGYAAQPTLDAIERGVARRLGRSVDRDRGASQGSWTVSFDVAANIDQR